MAAAGLTPRTAAAAAHRISRSVGAKLFTLVFAVLLLNLSLLGWANIRLHRHHLEDETLRAAERTNNVIARSIGYTMMHNDRDALRQVIDSVGREPAITSLRIFNHEGKIAFSRRPGEVGRVVSRDTQECQSCHASRQARFALTSSDRSRIFDSGGERTLGIITPIVNNPTCASAACHAHPASQRVLGLLDTNISLAVADANLRSATWHFAGYSALAILVTLGATGLFVLFFVHRPVATLRLGTERIGHGELDFHLPITTNDELGQLARSFNSMSSQLLDARRESESFARRLEERVAQKSAELQVAHQHMLQAEKLTSLGKLAAVVAHEINNPLSGILTYARLLRKWIERGDALEDRAGEMREALQLIESESRRCGDIVQSLLSFARVAPMNVELVDLNQLVRRATKLVDHKLELGHITQDLELFDDLPLISGDAAQLEQLVLALVMNAIEAMPHEGHLQIVTRAMPDGEHIELTVEDDGIGIPEEILAHLFEPFVTTKEEGTGVGLGLAVCRSVVDRHQGKISVTSDATRGTAFTVELPIAATLPAYDADRQGSGKAQRAATGV